MTGTRYGEKNVAIAGIGLSAVSRSNAKSALHLTVDACLEAMADAGLRREDIDGVATYPGAIPDGKGFSPLGPMEVRLALGIKANWYSSVWHDGPSQLGSLFAAIGAIHAGFASTVLVFRTVAEASARALDRNATVWEGDKSGAHGRFQWTTPFNAISPANWYALHATRHFAKYGTTEKQLGAIAVHGRKMASLNPKAIYRDSISIEDYLSSRMITSPLRLFDCDVPVDACTALILTRSDIARNLKNVPLRFEAIGSAFHDGGIFPQPEYAEHSGAVASARMMWGRTDLKPADVDVAGIYDGFSILSLLWLEALGFCGKGESGPYVEGGARIGLDGELPINTGGGQLSGGRLHGFGHIHEACTQLWGRGEARQVRNNPGVAAVCNGGGGAGCMLLVRE